MRANEIAVGRLEPSEADLQMIGEPDVVLVQKGDEGGACAGHPDVVGSRLLAIVERQIDEANPTVSEVGDGTGRFRTGRVANNNDLDILKRLRDSRAKREREDVRSAVGSNNHRHQRFVRNARGKVWRTSQSGP